MNLCENLQSIDQLLGVQFMQLLKACHVRYGGRPQHIAILKCSALRATKKADVLVLLYARWHGCSWCRCCVRPMSSTSSEFHVLQKSGHTTTVESSMDARVQCYKDRYRIPHLAASVPKMAVTTPEHGNCSQQTQHLPLDSEPQTTPLEHSSAQAQRYHCD